VRVGKAIGNAVRLFLSLPGKLLALPGEMIRLGGEIVSGLINGIKQKLAAAGEAIKSVGASVRDTFKGLLGIRSPSRVFAEMGGNLSEGLAVGMGAKLSSITKAAAGMAAAASVSLGLPAIAGQAMPALPDANQTIRQAALKVPDLPDAPGAARPAAGGAGAGVRRVARGTGWAAYWAPDQQVSSSSDDGQF
jgi:hypothetical protein